MTDIVERLRICATGPGDTHTVVICRLTRDTARDAADEIERLRAERDMWRQENLKKQIACEQMGARIVTLEAERDAARREGIEAAIVACGSVSAETEGVWSHGFTRGIIEAQASIRALLEGER